MNLVGNVRDFWLSTGNAWHPGVEPKQMTRRGCQAAVIPYLIHADAFSGGLQRYSDRPGRYPGRV